MRGRIRRLFAVLSAIGKSPWVYDIAQCLLGCAVTRERLRKHLAGLEGARVLDLGGGTGNLRSLLTEPEYVYVDIDPVKLKSFRRKFPADDAVLADATALPFEDRSFDVTACIAVAHHLDDSALHAFVDEAARVTRHRLVFLDPVKAGTHLSRALWRLDRGGYPRTSSQLLEELGRRFEIDVIEPYRIVHSYLLCVARPRRDEGQSRAGHPA